jgi:hypothetical protein
VETKNITNFINSSSLGVYEKYIVIKDNHKYLVKSGRSDGERESLILEPVTECICYELAKLMGIDCAEYMLEKRNGRLVSVSKWFYNEEEERFYSANRLMRILGISRENLYNKLVEAFPQTKMDLNNMIVFDYIVNNTDRHLKNFAFLEKDDKLRFAPIYDNGLSLGAHLDEDDLINEDIDDLLLDSDYAKCFESSNRKQLRLVDKHSLNIDIDFKPIVDKYKEYFSEKRVDFIFKLLEERIRDVRICFLNQ